MSSIRPESIKIPSGDVTLAGESWGQHNDPLVVLLHGGGQTRRSWRDTASSLAQLGWWTVSMDLRGHGDSSWSPSRAYEMDDFSSDVENLVRQLGQPPVLVGASLGGISALAAVGRHPDLALGVVLVDVSPFVQPDGTRRIREFMTAHPDGFATLDDAADAVARYLPHRGRPANVSGLRRNLRQVDSRWYWHWDPAFMRIPVDQPVIRDTLLDPVRLGAAAASLRLPTLLIRGEHSDVLSSEDAKSFLRLVPHAEFAEISGAYHMVAGDDNSAFFTVTAQFLDRRIRSRIDALAPAAGPATDSALPQRRGADDRRKRGQIPAGAASTGPALASSGKTSRLKSEQLRLASSMPMSAYLKLTMMLSAPSASRLSRILA
jgi:pimeloyl-ACP methyl ester carboxylesterase